MSTLRHHPDPDVAGVAALIGDPGRATMLHALLGGGELPASELAARAGITPQAATAHLKKLVAAGLLATHPSGRQRIFRLNSPEVGHALEALALIARPTRVVALEQSSALARLRAARSCYDHLAGRLGVAVTDALLERRILRPEGEHFGLTPAGARTLHGMGVDVEGARASRRSFARACTDWTERRPHLAGSLGAALLAHLLARGYVVRGMHDRSLVVSDEGRRALARAFALAF